jgi:predicted AAA+ superfamily ATPase
MFPREIQTQIEKWLFQNKILIIYGARQVGKTTLCKAILAKYLDKKSVYFNCEDPLIKLALIDKSAQQIQNFFGDNQIVVLDEAQTVPNIGRILKIFVDQYPQVQIIATGSSSFDLANQINEPLTGRSLEFELFALSVKEIASSWNRLELNSNLPKFLTYGLYPEIATKSNQIAKELVLDITKKYLFKDILNFEGIKNSGLVIKILQALAYQLGNEVSYTELANLVGSNKNTVEKYVDILEKSFIIFRLPAYSSNHRNEISKTRKIYFYDVGIRNALIEDFGNWELRNDRGAIWENFIILELMKNHKNVRNLASFYFWRTYTQQEIDLIIKQDGKLEAFEIKFNPKKKAKIPESFLANYPNTGFSLINQENWVEFVL